MAHTPTPSDNSTNPERQKGILGWIEYTGNQLPDPVFLFFWLIGGVIVISVIMAMLGVAATHPTQTLADGSPLIIEAASLLSADNLQRLLTQMPATFAHFHPLGYVLLVMLGAGVAERSGLFATAMSSAVKMAPLALLTPVVAFLSMMGNLAVDAAYVVLIPLAGVIYAAAGRHPIAGIAAAFAGVSGGFSANLIPGQLDALLFGITEAAVVTIDQSWVMNIAGNWFFIATMVFVYLPVIWYVTDKIIEPRLGSPREIIANNSVGLASREDGRTSDAERAGLRRAGLAALGIILLWVVLCFAPGTPLINEEAGAASLQPFYQSLVAAFFFLFLACGWAYGSAAGTIKDHRDVVAMMSGAMADLSYYIVLAFAAAHFVAMFNWSNLGLIFAINGAEVIRSAELPMPLLIGLIVLLTASINLFIGSASAKWALLAPVLVPMLILLGISPEMTTAAYRVGDGATNIITPLMPYFPLILAFCQRWNKNFGLGSLAATMIPYSIWMLITGVILAMIWVWLGLPLGPGVGTEYLLQVN
ncbi:MAG: AbgT family transporter [Pseudohongiella sp.]|nr:AbgT family transporter [Pseudohongiella sp.]MDP2126086.1 AbgT family transporter [Pseudohongiella sp.]